MKLAKEGKIILEIEEVVAANHAAVISQPLNAVYAQSSQKRPSCLTPGAGFKTIQFGSFEPVQIQISLESQPDYPITHKEPSKEDDEGWILVTKRKSQKQQVLLRPKVNANRVLRKDNTCWRPRRIARSSG